MMKDWIILLAEVATTGAIIAVVAATLPEIQAHQATAIKTKCPRLQSQMIYELSTDTTLCS